MGNLDTKSAPEPKLAGTEIVRRTEGVVEADIDGDRVLLSPTDLSYFGLSGTGLAVWERIDKEASIDAIIADLEREYEGDNAAVRSDCLEFVGGLLAAGLVEVSDGGDQDSALAN